METYLVLLTLSGSALASQISLLDVYADSSSAFDAHTHRIAGRSSPTYYSPSNYVQSPSYEHLAAMAHASLGHRGPVHQTTSQSGYRLRQPLTPVYHATPLQPYGALLDTAEEYKDDNSFVKPIVERQREESFPREHPRGQQSSGAAAEEAEAAAAVEYGGTRGGGSVGGLTEAIIHKQSITKHSPVVYESLTADKSVADYAYAHKEEDKADYAAKYQFAYQVRDPKGGNYFGHSESRDGHTTKGHYHVFLPDGRLQNVQYWTDRSGYHAQISYDRPETNHQ